MKLGEIIRELDKSISYSPQLAKMLESIPATLFLCQFLCWEGKQKNKDRWIYKTAEEIYDEIGITYKQQKTARHKLKDLGILKEKQLEKGKFGIDARNRQLHFLIDLDQLKNV